MIYLIAKVVVWLALAFLLGLALGWWLRRFRANSDVAQIDGQLASSRQQYELLEENSTTLRKSYSDLEQRLLDRSDAADKAEKARLAAEERLAEKEVEQTQLAGELELATTSLRKTQSELVTHQSSVAQLQTQVHQERSKAGGLRDRVQKLETQSSQLSDVNAEQLAELMTLRSKYEDQQTQLESLQTDYTNQSGGMNRLRQSFSALEARLLQAQQREQTLVAHEQSASTELERLKQEKATATEQLTGLTQSLDHAQARLGQIDSMREELGDQKLEIERLSRDVVKWRQRIPDLQSELDERDMELRNAQERLAEVEQASRRDRTLLQQQAVTAQQAVREKELALADQVQAVTKVDAMAAELAQLQAQLSQQQRLRGPRQSKTSVAQKDVHIARLTAKLSMLSAASPPPSSTPSTLAPTSTTTSSPTVDTKSEGAVQETPITQSGGGVGDARPGWLLDAAPADADDLQRIKGIGPKLSELLNKLGIYTFAQVARLDAGDIRWLDDQLDFKGRIERDNWVQQARSLAKR